MKSRTGIYSGTFDPIHEGHLAFAKETLKICGLDEVIFIPEANPRNKIDVTPIGKRVGYIQHALNKEKNMRVELLDTKQFSTKTALPELSNMFKNTTFTLLLGSDVIRTFTDQWPDLDLLLSSVNLAIGMRDGDSNEEIISILNNIQNKYNLVIDYKIINTKHSHLASSNIKRSV